MAAGRPSKYKEEYCDQVVEFFDRKPFEIIMVKDPDTDELVPATNKYGQPLFNPCELPTKESFAKHIGVDRDTVKEWAKVHPEFSAAIKKAEDLQKNILIQNGLLGNYDRTFAIFVAKNVTDMRDKIETEISNPEGEAFRTQSTWIVQPVKPANEV